MKGRDHRWSRRSILRGLGLGIVGSALPMALPRSRAQAGGHTPPIRFVTIFTGGGTIKDAWGTRRTDTDFRYGEILEPFEDLRDRALVLEGLDMTVAMRGPGGGHQRGPGVVLTGQPLLEGDFCGGIDCVSGASGWAAGPSIDQVIGDHLVGSTRIRSIEAGVRVLGANNRHRISFRAANEPVAPDDDPFSVWQRLFAGAGLTRAELELQRRSRGSVLDLVRGDLRALERDIGREHRSRLEAHVGAIRELERQLDAALEGNTCEAPDLPTSFDPHANDLYPDVSRLQLDLIVNAFACDATRVASLLYSGGNSYQTFPWINVHRGHHALSHEGDSNTRAQAALTKIDAWYASEIARFVRQLDAIPEGDGTLLDHTIVMWCNEVSKGNTHSHANMMFLLLGGSKAGLETGRWLRFGDRPHSDLLVSIAHAMGHTGLSRFGHDDYFTGPLTETGLHAPGRHVPA